MSIGGMLLFKEILDKKDWLMIASAVVSIALLSGGN